MRLRGAMDRKIGRYSWWIWWDARRRGVVVVVSWPFGRRWMPDEATNE